MDNRDVVDRQQQERNMAEAAVETPAARFFCHKCTLEINPVLPDYICPRCQGGFIEEVAQTPPEPSEESEDGFYNLEEGNDDFDPLTQVTDLWDMLGYMRAPNETTSSPNRVQQQLSEGLREAVRTVGRPGPSRRVRYNRTPNVLRNTAQDLYSRNRTEGFLHQLVTSLSENTGFVANASFPVFLNLHSNPGDYAWGRGGWNAIITQLINQLDGTGPPPLSKDKIDEIPTVEICKEQVEKNLQCTVCMEDFNEGEAVRRLSCDHHFHTGCITPWLELHGTCPICRKLLNDNPGSSESIFTNAAPTMSNVLDLQRENELRRDNESSDRSGYGSQQSSVYDFSEEFD